MDIPCAILIAAFCLPDANYKVEVKSGLEGADAIVALGEIRAHILLSDEEGAPPTAMDKQLCYEEVCVAYTARVRPEASAVELLIAPQGGGQERFIQLRGPLDQVAALSGRMAYAIRGPGRWVQIPLSEFQVSEAQPAAPPEPDLQQNPEFDRAPEADTAPFPDVLPLPDVAPEPQPDAPPETEQEWLQPNRPY